MTCLRVCARIALQSPLASSGRCPGLTPSLCHRYPLTPNATRYLQDHSQVVKSLAVLVSVGTDMTGPSGVNTSGGQQDAYNMQYTARLNAHTAACQPLGNLVEFRLRKIVGLPQFNRLSARLITAFLLNTDPVLRHRACCSIIDELMIAKQYRACVDLIDSGLFLHTHVSLDFLFCAAFCRAAYDSESWRFVVRLRNVCLATRLTLDYLSAWNVDVAVDMLKLCSHHLKSRHDVTNTTTPRASVTPPPSAGDASAPDLRHQVGAPRVLMWGAFRRVLRQETLKLSSCGMPGKKKILQDQLLKCRFYAVVLGQAGAPCVVPVLPN